MFSIALLLLNQPQLVYAGGIEVLRNEARQSYQQGIVFTIVVEGDTDIEQVTLLKGIEANDCMETHARQEIEIEPGKRVEAHWEWDFLQMGGLPSGVEVSWQWEIRAKDGTEITTEMQTMRLTDSSFKWHEVRQGTIILQYAEGGSGFGSRMITLASDSMYRLSRNAGIKPEGEIRMTIYPSVFAMQRSMAGLTQWAGGVAFPQYQVVLIGIQPDEQEWAEEVIPHELTHLITEMRVFNCSGVDLPTWLHEGLAMYAEGSVPQEDIDAITKVLEGKRLPELRSLSNGFSRDGREAEQAYKQSRMVVTYMIETLGSEKLNALLDQIQLGQRIDAAMRAVYGWDTDDMDQAWRASMGFGEEPKTDFSAPTAGPQKTAIPTLGMLVAQQATKTLTTTPTTHAPTETAVVVDTATPIVTATAEPSISGAEHSFPWPMVGGGAGVSAAVVAIVLFLRKKKN